MRKNLLFFIFLTAFLSMNAQSVYKVCGENKVVNSTFDTNENNSTNVDDWSFSPAGNEHGWKKAQTLIYGTYLVINRIGSYTASPNNVSLCPNGAKLIKFRFNTSGTGDFEYTISAGNQKLATFTNNGRWAQAYMSVEDGVEATLNREYLSEKTFNVTKTEKQTVSNNIWHEVELYIPNYTGGEGDVKFTYDRSSGILRQVMLDNVEVYDVLPKPEISNNEFILTEEGATFDLTSIIPNNKGSYTLEWYNASDNTKVDTPKTVGKGQYYAVFTSTCTGGCLSPKTFVTVSGVGCGNNIIKNGGFDSYKNSDNVTNGGVSIMSGTPMVESIPDWNVNLQQFTALGIGEYFGGNTALGIDPSNSTLGIISQPVELCSGGKYTLAFNFAMTSFTTIGQNRNVIIKLGNIELFKIGIKNRGGANRDVAIHSVSSYVSNFKIDNSTYNPSTSNLSNGLNTFQEYKPLSSILNKEQFYHLEVEVQLPNSLSSNDFKIEVNQGAVPYFDNISLTTLSPEADSPDDANPSVNCSTGTYNLKDTEPTVANHRYLWYYDEEMLQPVTPADDGSLLVPVGTYYMRTVSTCSGCKSEEVKPVTVNANSCAKITGTVYKDHDGNANGISNTGQPFSGGLYAVLVNSAGNVVTSQKVKSSGAGEGAGTYTLIAPSGNGYYVLLSNKKPEAGTLASDLTIGNNYEYTGETINNGPVITTPSSANTFDLSQGASAVVDFGITVKPIPGDVGERYCYNESIEEYTVPTLTGIDDDPTFNNGIGQTIIIKSLKSENGKLIYNGSPVAVDTEITSYDPSLLKYQITDNTKRAEVIFTYSWRDKGGSESASPGTVNVIVAAKLNAELEISKTAIEDCSEPIVLTFTFIGDDEASPYTFTYEENGETKTVETASGSKKVTVNVTPTTGEYTFELISVKDYVGCDNTVVDSKAQKVFVNCNGKVQCYKAPAKGGVTYPTKVGISTLARNMKTDWTTDSKNGFIKLESKTKGFTITRMSTTQIEAINNPVEGMLVWDIDKKCLKINTNSQKDGWKCITRGCN